MLTQERVRELFTYSDGKLYWTDKSPRKGYAGRLAGKAQPWRDGYYNIQIQGKIYAAHRLIFLFHHGYLPALVDHINQDKLDNRIENLRPATKKQNAENCKLYASNTSGHVGVSEDKKTGKWKAYRWDMGKYVNLGSFLTKEEAIEARRLAT